MCYILSSPTSANFQCYHYMRDIPVKYDQNASLYELNREPDQQHLLWDLSIIRFLKKVTGPITDVHKLQK